MKGVGKVIVMHGEKKIRRKNGSCNFRERKGKKSILFPYWLKNSTLDILYVDQGMIKWAAAYSYY